MKRFHKMAAGWDVGAAALALFRQPELWGQYSLRKEAAPVHGEMTDIWLRYNAWRNFDPADPAAFNAEHESVWYPAWYALPELRPLVFGLMNMVAGERLGGVLITKLPPGGQIAPHTDAGWHVEHYDKYYVTLNGAEGNLFWADDGEGGEDVIDQRTGDVYCFDNRVQHGVRNMSAEDRITLIVCIRSDRAARPDGA